MFLNIWNNPKNIIFLFDIFILILCYFWRQNCLKMSSLALLATLVNTRWPYLYDMTKRSLGACKYTSQVPFPHISRDEIQNSSWGVEKTIFLSLQAVDGITIFKFLWDTVSELDPHGCEEARVGSNISTRHVFLFFLLMRMRFKLSHTTILSFSNNDMICLFHLWNMK